MSREGSNFNLRRIDKVKQGSAIALMLHGEQYHHDLANLTSTRKSALCIKSALSSGALGLPEWKFWGKHLEEIPVISIGRVEQDLKPLLNLFSEEADSLGVDCIFLFAAGHGQTHSDDPRLLGKDSPPTQHSGLKISEIIAIIAGHTPKHVVALFDLCRLPTPGFDGSFSDSIKLLSGRWKGVTCVLSAPHGFPAQGGIGIDASLFARATQKTLSSNLGVCVERSVFLANLQRSLVSLYEKEKLEYTLLSSALRGDSETTIFGASPSFSPKLHLSEVKYEEKNNISKWRKIVSNREKISISRDRFLSSEKVWPLEISNHLGNWPAVSSLAGEAHHLLIVGGSGYGKTILAKLASQKIASQSGEKRLPIYLNMKLLHEIEGGLIDKLHMAAKSRKKVLQVECISEILQRYLNIWRYQFSPPATKGNIANLIGEKRIVIFLDALDELNDETLLKSMLSVVSDCCSVRIFCQPAEETIAIESIRSAALLVYQLSGVSIVAFAQNMKGEYGILETFGERQSILTCQLIGNYVRLKGRLPAGQKELSQFTLKTLESRVMEFSIKLEEVRGVDVFLVLIFMAKNLREWGGFSQFSKVSGIRAINSVLKLLKINRKGGLSDQLFLVFFRLRIVFKESQSTDIFRFENRRLQDRLIACAWLRNNLTKQEVLGLAADSLWESAVMEWLMLQSGSIGTSEIVEANPYLAANYLSDQGLRNSEEVTLISEKLLSESSRWARSAPSRSLGSLSTWVSKWLQNRFKSARDTNELITISLSLGHFDDQESTEFLIGAYEEFLLQNGERFSRIRRRILDALVGKVSVPKAQLWIRKRKLSERELARVIRSCRVSSDAELESLAALTTDRKTCPAIPAWLKYHEYLLRPKDQLLRAEVIIIASRSLVSTRTWCRSNGALLIDLCKLSELAPLLRHSLITETDQYVAGDMAYALGGIADPDAVSTLIDLYGDVLSGIWMLQAEQKGLLNDIFLGIQRAIADVELAKVFSEHISVSSLTHEERAKLKTIVKI